MGTLEGSSAGLGEEVVEGDVLADSGGKRVNIKVIAHGSFEIDPQPQRELEERVAVAYVWFALACLAFGVIVVAVGVVMLSLGI